MEYSIENSEKKEKCVALVLNSNYFWIRKNVYFIEYYPRIRHKYTAAVFTGTLKNQNFLFTQSSTLDYIDNKSLSELIIEKAFLHPKAKFVFISIKAYMDKLLATSSNFALKNQIARIRKIKKSNPLIID